MLRRMPARVAQLNLNLLVVLDALLAERNVTRAGKRIGLSQPATSAALAQLRRFFDNELLVRNGRGYELTPVALGLGEGACNRSPSRFRRDAGSRLQHFADLSEIESAHF